MERQFCINWPALVAEAKQRRRTQRLTQARLAALADVSTPTISHFENGKKDIQLSTVISILTVLGMNDQRNLIFIEQDERYDSSRRVVLFKGRDGDKVIQCAISKEALEDYFQGDGKDPVKVFQAHREDIEHRARRKYLAGKSETNGSVLLQSDDFG
jgi:transcriptional regulator with XRE-family HTH domain